MRSQVGIEKNPKRKKDNFFFFPRIICNIGFLHWAIIVLTINVGTYFVSNIPLKSNKSNNINNHNKSIIMENFNSNNQNNN